MSKSLPEPFAARPPQANTLKAKTDMTSNVRSADNPESEMDAHGKAAMTSDSDHGMKFAHPGRKKRKRGGMVEGAKANMHLGRKKRVEGGATGAPPPSPEPIEPTDRSPWQHGISDEDWAARKALMDKGYGEAQPGKADGGRAHRAAGGKTKGKGNTTINIVMPQGAGSGNASPMPMRAGPPALPPPAAPMPPRPPMAMPPQGMPMMPPGGMPPGAMGMPPGGAPPMPPQGMPMRAKGGKVYPKMRYGAGDGLGREEKIEKYGKRAYEGEKK